MQKPIKISFFMFWGSPPNPDVLERFKKDWRSEKSMTGKIMNRRHIKSLIKSLENQYSLNNLDLDYIFILNSEDKIHIVDKKLAALDLENIRVNSVGLYFCTMQDSKVRLSIEGSQIIGPSAKSNVLVLSKDEIKNWIGGNDLDKECSSKEFMIIKYDKDFYGSGKCKNGKVLNYIPKSRRIKGSNMNLEVQELVKSGGND